MTQDENKAKELHDRSTRGQALTAEEQAQLEAWYQEQDQTEFQQLGLTASTLANTALSEQIGTTLEQLAKVTARIKTLAAENDALRRENLILRRQLSERPLPQSV